MKTTSFIPPALLITGLLLSGCSGLDDPEEDNGDDGSVYDGLYNFLMTSSDAACTEASGIMRVVDGKVSGSADNLDTGEEITSISGSVDNRDGFVEGNLTFSFADHSGTYSGKMEGEECELPTSNTFGGINVSAGTSEGTWKDNLSCAGKWYACK